MRIYKSKHFAKFAQKEDIRDVTLRRVIKDADEGKIDTDYGGGVIKQRIARPNEGKSGGYRTIIYYRKGDKAFFVFGFAKKDQENISHDEVKEFKRQAKATLSLDDNAINKLLKSETYQEITGNDKNENL